MTLIDELVKALRKARDQVSKDAHLFCNTCQFRSRDCSQVCPRVKEINDNIEHWTNLIYKNQSL